jgi:hypothetical protein
MTTEKYEVVIRIVYRSDIGYGPYGDHHYTVFVGAAHVASVYPGRHKDLDAIASYPCWYAQLGPSAESKPFRAETAAIAWVINQLQEIPDNDS